MFRYVICLFFCVPALQHFVFVLVNAVEAHGGDDKASFQLGTIIMQDIFTRSSLENAANKAAAPVLRLRKQGTVKAHY